MWTQRPNPRFRCVGKRHKECLAAARVVRLAMRHFPLPCLPVFLPIWCSVFLRGACLQKHAVTDDFPPAFAFFLVPRIAVPRLQRIPAFFRHSDGPSRLHGSRSGHHLCEASSGSGCHATLASLRDPFSVLLRCGVADTCRRVLLRFMRESFAIARLSCSC